MIKIKIENKICFISVNRPKYLNALNVDVIKELTSIFNKYKNSKEIRSIILTGEGDKAFIAGADIKAMSEMSSKAFSFWFLL